MKNKEYISLIKNEKIKYSTDVYILLVKIGII